MSQCVVYSWKITTDRPHASHVMTIDKQIHKFFLYYKEVKYTFIKQILCFL